MRYTVHAEQKMAERAIGRNEVESIVANPSRGIYEPLKRDRREHYGYAADGRSVNVVTNRAETVVITVVEQ
jgi:hypothetical protein